MNTRIRRIRAEDVDSVIAIEQASFPNPWDNEIFEFLTLYQGQSYRIRTRSDEFVFMSVLEENFNVVGYVVWSEYRSLKTGRIWNLAVRKNCRKRGYGRKLLSHAIDNMRMRDLLVCRLEVRESNTAARCLYESEGMKAIDRVPEYYRSEDALIYSKEL